jgi:hypothetical protein
MFSNHVFGAVATSIETHSIGFNDYSIKSHDAREDGGLLKDSLEFSGGSDGLSRHLAFAFAGFHLTGDVTEITYDSIAVFLQWNAADLPFISLARSGFLALQGALGHHMGFPGFERVAKPADDFIRIGFGPEEVDHLSEVAAAQVANIPEEPMCKGIHRANSQVAIHQVTPRGRVGVLNCSVRRRKASSDCLHAGHFEVSLHGPAIRGR